jgi:hypothetical protein
VTWASPAGEHRCARALGRRRAAGNFHAAAAAILHPFMQPQASPAAELLTVPPCRLAAALDRDPTPHPKKIPNQVMYVHQQRVSYPGTPLQLFERVQGFTSQKARAGAPGRSVRVGFPPWCS